MPHEMPQIIFTIMPHEMLHEMPHEMPHEMLHEMTKNKKFA